MMMMMMIIIIIIITIIIIIIIIMLLYLVGSCFLINKSGENRSRQRTVVGCCERGHEFSGTIKGKEFLGQLYV
jgi:flagellar basal body-associated protein FliL